MNKNPKYRNLIQTTHCVKDLLDTYSNQHNNLHEDEQYQSYHLYFLTPRNTEYIIEREYNVLFNFLLMMIIEYKYIRTLFTIFILKLNSILQDSAKMYNVMRIDFLTFLKHLGYLNNSVLTINKSILTNFTMLIVDILSQESIMIPSNRIDVRYTNIYSRAYRHCFNITSAEYPAGKMNYLTLFTAGVLIYINFIKIYFYCLFNIFTLFVINLNEEFESIKTLEMTGEIEIEYQDVAGGLVEDSDKLGFETLWAFNELTDRAADYHEMVVYSFKAVAILFLLKWWLLYPLDWQFKDNYPKDKSISDKKYAYDVKHLLYQVIGSMFMVYDNLTILEYLSMGTSYFSERHMQSKVLKFVAENSFVKKQVDTIYEEYNNNNGNDTPKDGEHEFEDDEKQDEPVSERQSEDLNNVTNKENSEENHNRFKQNRRGNYIHSNKNSEEDLRYIKNLDQQIEMNAKLIDKLYQEVQQ
eukprot:Mrub_02959.p1 GENE.Mrub_02959~~Mrub_02959.p1  ORF type:complete len:507 (+),score=37.53 Mrub_02959:116-1522(+)